MAPCRLERALGTAERLVMGVCVCVFRVAEDMGCCCLFRGLERQDSIVVKSGSMGVRPPCTQSVTAC